MAREARVGVVIRRGPSKQVLLLKWDLETDTFEEGQWLKGRIYERRCDLSPDGEHLIYFAADYKRKGPYSWTAISKPPWLKAILFWPKGDAWWGGGLFEDNTTVRLNHQSKELPLLWRLTRKSLAKAFQIIPFVDPHGEDGPIYYERMVRDGWDITQDARDEQGYRGGRNAKRAGMHFKFKEPQIMERSFTAGGPSNGKLICRLKGMLEIQGTAYVEEFDVSFADGREISLGRLDWADIDRGSLVYARSGRIFRIDLQELTEHGPDASTCLVDLAPLTFEAKAAPYDSPYSKYKG